MDAKSILREVLLKVAAEQNYYNHDVIIKPISSGGANYTSTLFQASITAPSREPLQLFAKVATIGEKLREKMNGNQIFETERYFYTQLMKKYESIQDKQSLRGGERVRFPVLYGVDATYMQETIVLEDLVASGFSVYNRFNSCDWEYAAAAIKELAKLHALSLALQEHNPTEFDKILEERKFVIADTPEGEENAFTKLLKSAFEVMRPEFVEKLQNFLKGQTIEDFRKYYSSRRKAVLTHGDYRPSNLMSRKVDGAVQVIPVDYQTVHAGCPAHDLVYFIYISSDKTFRKKHFNQLIDHYYTELNLASQRLGLNLEELYPRKTFDQDFNDALAYGLIIALYVLPIVTVEEDHAPKLDDDFMTSFGEMKTNDIYKERLNDILEEFVERGIL